MSEYCSGRECVQELNNITLDDIENMAQTCSYCGHRNEIYGEKVDALIRYLKSNITDCPF